MMYELSTLYLARDLLDVLEASPLSDEDKRKAIGIAQWWAGNVYRDKDDHRPRGISWCPERPYSREYLQQLEKSEKQRLEKTAESCESFRLEQETRQSECDAKHHSGMLGAHDAAKPSQTL
ncbi:MAG: hypothetical protein H0V88_01875 [Pyrinomonadaceae bacterium]|nr:hypothetical protein [Pyrinomonadaceae bacterium]